MLKDVGTGWRELMPVPSKSDENTHVALRDFVGNRNRNVSGTVDREIIAAVDGLRKDKVYDWVHSEATPPS